MSGGSAGTLEVTLGAKYQPLVEGMKKGEDALRSFGRTAEAEGARADRAMSSFGRGLKPIVAGAAASLAMLAGESNDTAGALARVFSAGMAGAAGGPWGAALAAGVQGVRELLKSSNDAEDATKKLNAARAQLAMDEMRRKQDFLVEQRRAADVASGRATAGDFAASDAGMSMGSDAEEEVRRRQRAEQQRSADAAMEASRNAERRSNLGADSPIVKGMERQAEIDKIRAQYAADIADEVIRQKEAEWAAADAAERFAASQEEAKKHEADLKKVTEDLARAEEDREKMRRRIAERARDEARETERARDRMREINQAFDDRLRVLGAATDLERLQVRNAQEYRDAIASGVPPAKALESVAKKTADYLKEQAAAAAQAAEAEQERVLAAERMAHEARNRAREEERAADAASRASQMNTFGAGYGPLAQARDAKRRNSNIARFKNHADNLAAERRETSAYGNVGAPQFDANGNPIGVADPFAFDLGSIAGRTPKQKLTPDDYAFKAPGLLAPPPPEQPSAPSATDIFGPLGAAGDAMKAGGEAATQAAAAVGEAAGKMSSGADDIAQGSGEIADQLGAAADSVGRAAEAIAGIDEALSGFNDRLATLEAALAAASFFGG